MLVHGQWDFDGHENGGMSFVVEVARRWDYIFHIATH